MTITDEKLREAWEEIKLNAEIVREEERAQFDIVEAALAELEQLRKQSQWQPIKNWRDDMSFGEYVLVHWNSGIIEEMHWASVESRIKPICESVGFVTHFCSFPTPPAEGKR
jgi:hypothetical protein